MNVRTAVAEPASVHQELSFTDAMFQKYKSDGPGGNLIGPDGF